MDLLLAAGLIVCGVFSLALGIVHFTFPVLFDVDRAILGSGGPLKPFRLGPIRYATTRQDVRGITWVMNHAASFGLVSVGLADLLVLPRLPRDLAALLALWIAAWWFLRAGSQLYLGTRRGDWLILGGFAALGVFHLVYAAAVWP
jgi:hypothetical protein